MALKSSPESLCLQFSHPEPHSGVRKGPWNHHPGNGCPWTLRWTVKSPGPTSFCVYNIPRDGAWLLSLLQGHLHLEAMSS